MIAFASDYPLEVFWIVFYQLERDVGEAQLTEELQCLGIKAPL
jgi:hypothetical protein